MNKTKKLSYIIFAAIFSVSLCFAAPKEQANQGDADVKFVMQLQTVLEEGNLTKAIALFDNIPSSLKEDIGLKSLLGALYYSNQDFDKAINVAKEILAVDKNNLEAMELLSHCYKATKNTRAYSEITTKILEIDPYNPAINIQKAEEQVLRKKWKLARTYYSKALKGDENNIDAILGFGTTSYFLNDIKNAEQAFFKILDKDPTNPEALSYLSKIEYERENYQNAVDFIKLAISNNPTNYNYWMDLGNYLRYQGKYADAEQAWIKATEIDPNYFLAYAYLAGIYDEQGMFDKALENYHKVIETNPKYFYAYEATAILEYHAEHYENAIKYFSKAYEYNDSYSYTLMMAACYYKLKKPLDAKKILAAQMKKLNNKSTEYDLVRFYHDTYNRNAEQNLIRKINAEENRNTRCKMLFYMGLYNEIYGSDVLAKEFYIQATDIQAPMFFEYRIAEWGLNK